jgi:hypothetical protein
VLADAEFLTKSGETVIVKDVPAVRDPDTGKIVIHKCDACVRLKPEQRDGCVGCRKKPKRYSRCLKE